MKRVTPKDCEVVTLSLHTFGHQTAKTTL